MAGLKKKEKKRLDVHEFCFTEYCFEKVNTLYLHTRFPIPVRAVHYGRRVAVPTTIPINQSINPLANHLNLRICDVSYYSYRHGIMQSSMNISYTRTLTRQGLWYPNLLE